MSGAARNTPTRPVSSREFICQTEHTPHPEGYIAHAEWAERMLVTHKQIKCPGCGLWKVWIPRDPADLGGFPLETT